MRSIASVPTAARCFTTGNTAQSAIGASWKIRALILSLFLEIHKVFLQKNAFIRTQIFSGFALAELCGVALKLRVILRTAAPNVKYEA